MLRDIEELSTSEVAEVTGLTEANVKVRLHRARAALKKLLSPIFEGQELVKIMPHSVRQRIKGIMFKLPMMITCVEFEDFILAYLDDESEHQAEADF